MGKKGFWIATIGIIVGFGCGFFFANTIDRREIDSLKAKLAQAQAAAADAGKNAAAGADMTPGEIKQMIDQAEQSPDNIDFQRKLGLSLYLYAGMRKEIDLLPDAKRLMLRAYAKTPKDRDLLVALGNVNFDIAQSTGENKNLEEARDFYRQAIALRPNDVELQTDIGSTYFTATPPEYDKAAAEYRKSLQIDPHHARTLDNFTRTLIMMGNIKEAEISLAKLKKANPGYQGLASLEEMLAGKTQTQ